MKKQLLIVFLSIVSVILHAQTQPAQPATGYGGVAAPYASFTTFNADDGATGFMLYIPSAPHADSLPLIVFDHGFGEWNPLRYGRWIEHLVKRGNIVVFPRYQLSEYTTPSTSFTPNAVTGILRAIDTLRAHPTWTQPELDKVFYMGHSYGGLITANLATNYSSYHIPKPKAILMACPGYGTYPGGQLLSYSAMDSSIYVLDIFEKDDNVVDSTFALQVFNQTTAVPYAHKNLVIHFADSLGIPPVTSTHGESSCIDSTMDNGDRGIVMTQATYAYTDVTDFYCYWKLFDALEDCALTGNGCTTAFGDTHAQRNMGLWSNGTPVTLLDVRPANVLTAIAPFHQVQDISMYPNPGNGLFTIYTENDEAGRNARIEIYDVLGNKIHTEIIYSLSSHVIDLTKQSTGIYLVRILSENGELLTNSKLILR
ncbi:MAG TPA: T9SS type A sorting domain-containing protein [Bacteroidia bacterium]|jgi:pimeloyl-ACP methyl ester carboxylesterase|nr:T9SS type A sorting domain-containing protein [Bacteroidia bacterium]